MVNSFSRETCSVYEIYPQSETPSLTQVAHLDFNPPFKAYLLPGIVIWCYYFMDRSVFRVWDYHLNHSITFSVDNLGSKHDVCFIPSEALKLASNSFVGR